MEEGSLWEVVCSEEQFELLRKDERFVALLTLARAVNAVRFYHLAYLAAKDDETPSGKRQRVNAFMFTSAALYESLGYAGTLGRFFAEVPAFECLGALLGRKDVKAYRQGIARHLRNKVTAHFDEQITAKTLADLQFARPRLATGQGRTVGDSYYELADEVAVHSALVADADEPRPWDELAELMAQTAEISAEFGKCSDKLIANLAEEMGWSGEPQAST